MGHPNEDLVRQGYEAFASGDMQKMGELFADDIVWHAPGNNPISGTYKGKDEVFGLFAKIVEETGGSFKLDVHDIVANDAHAVGLVTGSAQRGDKSIRSNDIHVFHIEGGKVTEFWNRFEDQAEIDAFWS